MVVFTDTEVSADMLTSSRSSVRSGVSERLGLCDGERDAPQPALEDAAQSAGHLQDQ